MHWRYSSDYHTLRSVIVHTPDREIRKIVTLVPTDHPATPQDYIGVAAQQEHRAFTRLLQQQGVCVYELKDLLNRALHNAHADGMLADWLRHVFGQQVLTAFDIETITAADILGISDRSFYHYNADLRFAPLWTPQPWMFFCRDFAALTPKGLIVCNFANAERAREPHIGRFLFDWAQPLHTIPVAFDAVKEEVYIQGGDIIPLNNDTLLLGVNNLSERRAARMIAEKLDMRVVTVNLPPAISISHNVHAHVTGVNLLFLHLDSVLAFVDNSTFLVVPYWFETGASQERMSDPLADIFFGLIPHHRRYQDILAQLRQTGWITIYHPGTGRKETPHMKLVDFLNAEGYSQIYVGGDPGSANPHKHILEHVLPEVRFQAANLLALRPGEVISYAGHQEHTIAALRARNIKVHTFESHEIIRWYGGPHCMSLPLERYGFASAHEVDVYNRDVQQANIASRTDEHHETHTAATPLSCRH